MKLMIEEEQGCAIYYNNQSIFIESILYNFSKAYKEFDKNNIIESNGVKVFTDENIDTTILVEGINHFVMLKESKVTLFKKNDVFDEVVNTLFTTITETAISNGYIDIRETNLANRLKKIIYIALSSATNNDDVYIPYIVNFDYSHIRSDLDYSRISKCYKLTNDDIESISNRIRFSLNTPSIQRLLVKNRFVKQINVIS